MSRRANIVLLVTVTACLLYGLIIVPWAVAPDPRDVELQQLREENESLTSLLDNNEEQIIALKKERRKWRVLYQVATTPRNAWRSPPSENITGVIKAVSEKDNFVTINLGSDSDLSRDNTLEVYRDKPKPTYVGIIRIVEVRPSEAVARFCSRRVPPQVGDEVTNESMATE
jgi:hypothetical protein